MPVTFALRLGDDGSPDDRQKYTRIPPPVPLKPYSLRFFITAGSTASCDAYLVTNYPEEGRAFEREKFRRIQLQHDDLKDAVCDIVVKSPGVFEYYVEYRPTSSPDGGYQRSKVSGSIVIDPRLYLPNTVVGDSSQPSSPDILLPLDGICILTVIPKWMPTINRWPDFFKSFTDGGYNMLHFAPLSTRGSSNSPYSIYDQLSISPDLFEGTVPPSEEERERLLLEMLVRGQSEFGLLSITDVVWNHTACNSEWLQLHPEAGYNLKNSPHLRIAYELDEALMHMSDDLVEAGISVDIKSEETLQAAMGVLREKVLPKLRLWEFYVADVKAAVSEFRSAWRSRGKAQSKESSRFSTINLGSASLKERGDVLRREALYEKVPGGRFGKAFRMDVSVYFMESLLMDLGGSAPAIEEAQISLFEQVVNEVNLPFYQECDGDIAAIAESVTNRSRYLRVDGHGPKLGPVTKHDPIVDTYFTRIPRNETTQSRHPDELYVANNGWIWNADPLMNFAGPESKAYLRREVIAWGDCVKLRYGNGPEDNPWLWSHQKAYTEKMARLFHGFRIDNCHSTPIHVAAYLLDAARRVRPDLYVFAELFTGSEDKDITFVSKLGINSLIREAMNAWDPKELSRLVHRFGGEPVGSFTFPPEHFPLDMLGHALNSTFYNPVSDSEHIVVEVRGSSPHALFMDCTHDNETPHQKRTAEDTLPTAALVAMANCAVGSVKGFDEVIPELLNVVTETRKYRLAEPYEGIIPDAFEWSINDFGGLTAKSILLNLHTKMAREGYNEIHVHQEHDFISVHRVHPVTHDGYLLIARCAFSTTPSDNLHSPIILRNQSAHIIESAGLRVQIHAPGHTSTPYIHHEDDETDLTVPTTPTQLFHTMGIHPADADAIKQSRDGRSKIEGRKTLGAIAGLPCFLDFSSVLTTLAHSKVVRKPDGGVETVISVDGKHFLPGSVVLYRTWMVGSGMEMDPVPLPTPSLSISVPFPPPRPSTPEIRGRERSVTPSIEKEGDVEKLWRLVGLDQRNFGIGVMVMLGRGEGWGSGGGLGVWGGDGWPMGLLGAVAKLGVEEINIALFRCGSEEMDTIGENVYDVPGHGSLSYCGFQGFASALQPVSKTNNLGHPICENLRQGPWMMDYVVTRLEKYSKTYPALLPLMEWLRKRFMLVKTLPPSFTPKYFSMIILMTFTALRHQAITSTSLQAASSFIRPTLTDSSSLARFAQNLAVTAHQFYGAVKSTGLYPPSISVTGKREACLAAGLPHFATQHMRCWGRDIFISLRGLFLIPGHFKAARQHIMAFGSTLKHGLIPNLLDQGSFPRYNARDAAWWWVWGVIEYCRASPEGIKFLEVSVRRRFLPRRRYRKDRGEFLKVSITVDEEDGDAFSPTEDTTRSHVHTSTIADLCHEILERHAWGLRFREFNAGPNLDHAMSDKGFEVECGTRFSDGSGIVWGGNRFNCGTWMDKMGDSERAGVRGVPATPRDGAGVEIVGLVKAAVGWVVGEVLGRGVGVGVWPAQGVVIRDGLTERTISYAQWNDMLCKSFEKNFYIPKDPLQQASYNIDRPELINRRGIYKDTCGASQAFADYQFRPNFFVAMVVAPEMFNPDHARGALELAKEVLLGPLGMKTLDPGDWSYRGYYDNGNDSTDPSVAHGFNYHQGPEWVWLMGYFLRAYLYFNVKAPGSDPTKKRAVMHWIQHVLLRHKRHIADAGANPFAGLPELTNKDGEYCGGSCPTQAWSSATLLETVKDLHEVCGC
ncbi:hypothetical protein HDU67_006518 [Dinochytrium kinnereticum]|nr:hypothetical protein HDU67_006518 [Dinochytrium kinnereticum]